MSVAGRKRSCLTFKFEISRRIEDEDLLQLGHVCRGDLQRRIAVSREPPSGSAEKSKPSALTHTHIHTGARTQIPHAKTRVQQHCSQLSYTSVVKQTQFIYLKSNIAISLIVYRL